MTTETDFWLRWTAGWRKTNGKWLIVHEQVSDERPNEFIGITAGSLDDPSSFRPQMDFFVSDAQP